MTEPIHPGQNAGAMPTADDAERVALEHRLRERHPHLDGFLQAMQEPPLDPAPFRVGQHRETAVATTVDQRADDRALSLHDRAAADGGGVVAHLAVAPSGVFVIETRGETGAVTVERPRLRGERLRIDGTDHTAQLDGLDRQVAAVRAALGGAGHGDVPVRGAICFTRAELQWADAGQARGHLLLYRRELARRLNADGPLSPEAIAELHRHLAAALPPA